MRKQCTIVLLLITGAAAAQTTLPNSRQTSERRYLYRLSNEQAAAVARKGLRPAIAEAWLRQPVDSVAIDRPLPPLAPGNYLQVHAAGSQLQMQLVVQPNCQVKAMGQYRTLAVLVHDSLGQPISQANVLLRRKKLNFDPVTQTYRLRKARKDGLLQVQYNGLVNLHRLESEAAMHGHLWQKLKHAFPVRQFRQLFQGQQKKHRYRNYFRHEAAYQQKFHAYLVFSKPIYKPGDTVHFKAFIVPKRGKPVNRPLLLRLTSRDFKKDTIVTTLHPYRPGGYVGSLVLNDSLDLDLDEDYLLTLEETKSRRYNLSEYDGDWDDDNYALQRKILARGEFKLEEYQLNQISFQLRADKSNHGPGNLVSLFAKATDENDLPVPDGRLEVVVTTNRVLQYHRPRLFVPDTLWRHKQPLDPVGETRFSLPDSIFPAADLAYTISATFLNSNNEAQQQTLHQQYQYQAHQLLFQPYLDSLRISYQHLGNGRTQGATITQWAAQGQRIGTQRVQLPTAIWLNPFMESCTVQTDSAHATYTVQHSTATIQFFTRRTADSVFIYTSNPRQLPFWFTLLAGKRPLQKGYVRQLNIAQKSTTRQNYFLLVQYVWGNKLQKHEYYLPYHTKTLTLQVEQPTQVYPGEQRSISITVKDNCGRPVADADVTAWAFTKKFPSVREPKLPFVNKTRPGLGRLPWYQAAQLANTSSSTLLNWQRWGHSMGLDSIAYFQFLHPQPIYQSTASMGDSITQLAPFVIKDGILQPIHLLYIDEKPVFFSQANHIKRYSFRVSPGQHALRLRTHNRLVQIDSIWVHPGVKNFLSVAADHPAINTTTVPDTLTYHEQQHWARCMTVLKNNYGDNFASVQQGQAIWLLPQNQPYANNWRYNSPYDILVGPLMPQEALLQVKTDFEQPFMPEPSYSFAIQQGLVKQKSLPVAIPFVAQLGYTAPPPPLQEKVLTQTELDSLWQDYLDNRTQQQQIFNNPNIYSKSRVHIRVDSLASGGKPFVKNLLLFRYDRADFVRVYRGNVTDLGSQEAGWHKLLLLLKGGQYVLLDSLFVQPFGHNFFATGPLRPHAADSIGLRLNEIIDGWRKWANGNYYGSLQGGGTDITETFNKRHFSDAQLTDIITGRVTDHKGAPIHKASVSIRGLSVGVLSDDKGYFAIKVPPTGMLMLSAVGYETVFVPFKGSGNENITLVANQGKLAEVVVTGYSIQRKKSMAGALTNISGDQLQRLTGRVPGVQIKAVDLGNNTRIILRGLSSLNELKAPLYVVDGVVYEGNIAELDPSRFAALEFLKDGSALYGAAASDGVVIITTHKKGSPLLDSLSTGALEEPAALPNTLRRRFRDDGFWQPRLRTDANGQARFSVVFPDDITQWRSFYAAMTAQKQVGITEMGIRSYKPLSAVLALPSFLVQGDSSRFIGKVLNYTSDTALAIRSILINGKPIAELPIQVTNARIDTIEVKAVSTDSVAIQYTIRQSNGYLDGEERRVPVVRQGVTETQGVFAVLDSDTSFALPPFQPGSPVTFHAEASVLPVLLDEVEKIKSYAYNCNEQLASKLQCLLLEKKIRQQLGQPFREEKNIQTLITKLNQNRGRNFMWGWWAQNDPSLWITLHVVEALLQAEAMGYGTMLARQPVIDYLVLNQESLLNDDQLRGWLLLQRLGAKADYKKYGDSLAARFKPKGLYQQLQWIAAQQQLGRPVAVDSVLQWASATMLGNLYWGEESYRFFDNAVQNTLLAYQILRQQGGYETELKKIRYYFLEKRKSGQWRNTYESARILAIILPDLLKEAQGQSSPSLRISGSRQQTVTQFPFTIQWDGQDSLVLHKKAGLPVYVAAWQQQHNPLPQAHKGQFEVTTRFERNGLPINQLKAGEAVTLTATVQVKADADYVMVEIPIPAGCSYKSKQQSHAHNEVHREHFTSKLSIFCAQLTKGTYRFSAELMPRYTGSYHLNPAKAEMMYFPVFYGREGMKQVVIE